MLLNIPGVIHLFVALLGPILGVLGVVSPKTLMEILVGGVGKPLNLLLLWLRTAAAQQRSATAQQRANRKSQSQSR